MRFPFSLLFSYLPLILLSYFVSLSQGKYNYVCTFNGFVRLGNSCYYFSSEIASWQESFFKCRDKGAQLAVLATQYEDSTIRAYLERPEFAHLSRWIGGIWRTGGSEEQSTWIWAAQGSEILYKRGFSTTSILNLPSTEQWQCLTMDPISRYHWTNENCIRQLHFICETPLTRINETISTYQRRNVRYRPRPRYQRA